MRQAVCAWHASITCIGFGRRAHGLQWPARKLRRALDSVVLHTPIHVGDVVLQNVCGTGADIVTCRNMD